MIEANKAKKQPKGLNGGLLPVATEPIQKSACIGNLHAENNTLPDDTDKSGMLPLPDDMPKSSPVGTDTTITNQSNMVPPEATNSQSTLPDKTNTQDDNAAIEPADEKPSRGVFKTMTITIRRSKDPHTFKCSVCGTRAPTLHELNAHFIQNHHNINCDICGKSFQTPVSLQKHRYSHIEESEQFQCRICDKCFPFKSQLKSHKHMHRRIRYYKCASANCDRSFRHPGDLAVHARSHGKPFDCAYCMYSNTDIRNLHSHMRVHSRDAPFTCKNCGKKFVHSNQIVRHKPKCEGNKPDLE